jgi:hypothetical protein
MQEERRMPETEGIGRLLAVVVPGFALVLYVLPYLYEIDLIHYQEIICIGDHEHKVNYDAYQEKELPVFTCETAWI